MKARTQATDVTRDKIEKYRKIIFGYIDQHPNLPAQNEAKNLASAVLTHLLDSYLGKGNTLHQIFHLTTRHHMGFAEKIKNEVKEKEFDLLNTLDNYFNKRNSLDKTGDFYALLVAYFIYFNDLYAFGHHPDLKKQLYIPVTLYKRGKKRAQIKHILEMTKNERDSTAEIAIASLGEISIPIEDKEGVINHLLSLVTIKGLFFVITTAKVLTKLGLSEEQRERLVNLIIENATSQNLDMLELTPRKIANSAEEYGELMSTVKKIVNPVNTYAITPVPSKNIDNINTDRDTMEIASIPTLNSAEFLSSKLERFLTIMRKNSNGNEDELTRLRRFFYQLSDGDKEFIVDVFCKKLAAGSEEALPALFQIGLSSEMLCKVIDALLDLKAKEAFVHRSLFVLSCSGGIPEKRNLAVFNFMVARLSDLNSASQFPEIVFVLTHISIPPDRLESTILEVIKNTKARATNGEFIFNISPLIDFLKKISIPDGIRAPVFNDLLTLVAKNSFSRCWYDQAARIPMKENERSLFQKDILQNLSRADQHSGRKMLHALYIFQQSMPLGEAIRIQIQLESMQEKIPPYLAPLLFEYIDKFEKTNATRKHLVNHLPSDVVNYTLKFNR